MIENEQLAIISSIHKWRDICKNVKEAANTNRMLKLCSLCYYSKNKYVIRFRRIPNDGISLVCPFCPLFKAGFPCLKEDSVFLKIRDMLDIPKYRWFNEDDLKKLESLCIWQG